MGWSILDCTLRDGGYYTNWDFESGLVKKYLAALDGLPIKFCEVGYRSPAKEGYFGEYFYLRYATLKSIHSSLNSNIKLALMLNAKDCTSRKVRSLLEDCHEFIGLIRIAISPDQLMHGLSIAAAVKECGFSVGVNIMHLHKLVGNHQWLFDELLSQKDVIDYLSFVDSFGSCFPDQIAGTIKSAKLSLPFNIGFHGHDNLGLAFANSLAAIEAGADIIDSTMLGLGRGAGNLRTELITAYFSKIQGRQNNFLQLADCLESWQILEKSFKSELDLPYIVSGLEQLPQAKVMELMGKKRYGANMIIRSLCKDNRINNGLSQHFPLLEENIDTLGISHIDVCILLGGGRTATDHCAAIKDCVKNHNAVIIHSSLKHVAQYEDSEANQFVCLSGDEASKLDFQTIERLSDKLKFIVTIPPRFGLIPEKLVTHNLPIFSVEPLAFTDDVLKKDTPLGLAIGLSQVLGSKEIMLAGFDGYPNGYSGPEQDLAREVQEVIDGSQQVFPNITVKSITPTRYKIHQTSVYALMG